MKITTRDIEPLLAAPDVRYKAVLFHGPDAGLARERAQRVKAKILTGDDPFAFVELTQDALLSDPARLADELSSIGLLSGKRCILIRDGGDKLANIMKEAAPALHPGVFLVVLADELGSRSALRKWFEDTPDVASVGCYRDDVRDLTAVVSKSLSAAGIQAPREVMDYLCAQLGNDREVTRSELEKVMLYAGDDKTLTVDDVAVLVDYNRDTSLDDVVNAVADKQARPLDALLAVHSAEGTAPVAYIRALLRYFNRLYFIKSRAEAGYDIETTVGNLRPPVHFKQKPLLIRHARNWGMPQIVKALKLLIAAEVASKTSDMPTHAATARRLFQVAQVR